MSTSRRRFLQGAAGAVALGAAVTPASAEAQAGRPAKAPDLAHLGPLATPRAPSALDGTDVLGGFRNPPAESLPRVWWHWMNQNITKDGIKSDLEWFKRIGVGGMVNFDG